MNAPVTITQPTLNPGETYAGAIFKPDGTGHHIIVLPTVLPALTWAASLKAAAEAGGDLPSRAEALLIWSHCKPALEREWHWTNEQNADWDDAAWAQDFGNGYQYAWGKHDEFPALVLRRQVIG